MIKSLFYPDLVKGLPVEVKGSKHSGKRGVINADPTSNRQTTFSVKFEDGVCRQFNGKNIIVLPF